MTLGWPKFLSNLWVRPKDWGGDPFHIFYSTRYGAGQKFDYLESFNCIPEVNAVINLKGNAFSNGMFKVIDAKKKDKEYPDEPILTLLNNPNWFQAKGEFMKQTKIGHEIFGNEFLYFLFPFGMPSNVKAIYTIIADMMTVEYNEQTPFFFFTKENPPQNIKYLYKDGNGNDKELPPESIVHLNDNRVGGTKPTDKNLLLGVSKLEALKAPIDNIADAYESRGMILRERGANGAWVNNSGKDSSGGSVPLRPKELTKLQEMFRNFGTKRGQRQFVIAPRDIRFEQAGNFKPKDLGLFDETEEDFRKIQDEFGTPPELFARPNGTTYENQRQARKGLYVETIIPEANEWTNGISSKVFPDGSKKIILEYTHLEIFQDDIKLKAEKNKTLIENLSLLLGDGAITLDEYREEIFKLGYGNGKPLPKPEPTTEEPAQEDGTTEEIDDSTTGGKKFKFIMNGKELV